MRTCKNRFLLLMTTVLLIIAMTLTFITIGAYAESKDNYEQIVRPLVVFDNNLREISTDYGDTGKILIRNRGTTSCGATAIVSVDGEWITLFEDPYLVQGGEKTYKNSFEVTEEYFRYGKNIIYVEFDYGGLRESATYELVLNVRGEGDEEETTDELIDNTVNDSDEQEQEATLLEREEDNDDGDSAELAEAKDADELTDEEAEKKETSISAKADNGDKDCTLIETVNTGDLKLGLLTLTLALTDLCCVLSIMILRRRINNKRMTG